MNVNKLEKAYHVRMGISLQMWTGLYVEPVPGRPETYEDENKRFILTKKELKRCVRLAQEQSQAMQSSVARDQIYERLGYTYAEVTKLVSGKSIDGVQDKPYQADEDLSFLFTSLGELWQFIFMANCTMES